MNLFGGFGRGGCVLNPGDLLGRGPFERILFPSPSPPPRRRQSPPIRRRSPSSSSSSSDSASNSAEIGRLQNKIRALERKIESLEGKVTSKERRIDSLNVTISNLNFELKTAKYANSANIDKIRSLESKIKQQDATLNKAKLWGEEISKELKAKKNSLASVEKQFAACENKVIESEKKNKKLNETVQNSEKEIVGLREKISFLELQIQRTQNNLAEKAAQFSTSWSRCEQELYDLNQAYEKLESNCNHQTKKLNELEKSNVNLAEQKAQIMAQLNATKKQMDIDKINLEARITYKNKEKLAELENLLSEKDKRIAELEAEHPSASKSENNFMKPVETNRIEKTLSQKDTSLSERFERMLSAKDQKIAELEKKIASMDIVALEVV